MKKKLSRKRKWSFDVTVFRKCQKKRSVRFKSTCQLSEKRLQHFHRWLWTWGDWTFHHQKVSFTSIYQLSTWGEGFDFADSGMYEVCPPVTDCPPLYHETSWLDSCKKWSFQNGLLSLRDNLVPSVISSEETPEEHCHLDPAWLEKPPSAVSVLHIRQCKASKLQYNISCLGV